MSRISRSSPDISALESEKLHSFPPLAALGLVTRSHPSDTTAAAGLALTTSCPSSTWNGEASQCIAPAPSEASAVVTRCAAATTTAVVIA